MFLETICIDNGVVRNWDAHIRRMKATAQHFRFTLPALPDVSERIPSHLSHEKVKCRILYSHHIHEITFEKYMPRTIQSLKMVHTEDIDYRFKSCHREAIHLLSTEKGESDEIIIVKKGYITDTSYTNVVFENREGLFTPDTYLLNGTMRQTLLQKGIIKEKTIRDTDLCQFDYIYLINAMLDLEYAPKIAIRHIQL